MRNVFWVLGIVAGISSYSVAAQTVAQPATPTVLWKSLRHGMSATEVSTSLMSMGFRAKVTKDKATGIELVELKSGKPSDVIDVNGIAFSPNFSFSQKGLERVSLTGSGLCHEADPVGVLATFTTLVKKKYSKLIASTGGYIGNRMFSRYTDGKVAVDVGLETEPNRFCNLGSLDSIFLTYRRIEDAESERARSRRQIDDAKNKALGNM